MDKKDLEIFNEMPFFCWVKGDDGRYLWANRTLSQAAQGDVTGKTDDELPWANNAGALQARDKQVMETGKPVFLHENLELPNLGKITVNTCKFMGEFEGQKGVFGVSFQIED